MKKSFHAAKSFYKKMFAVLFLVISLLQLLASFGIFYSYFCYYVDTLAEYKLQNSAYIKKNQDSQLSDVVLLTDNMYLDTQVRQILLEPSNPSENQALLQRYYQKQKFKSPFFACQIDLLDFYGNKYTNYASGALAHRYITHSSAVKSHWYKKAVEAQGKILWFDGKEINPEADNLIFAVRLIKSAMENRPMGVAIISFLKRSLEDELSDYVSPAISIAIANRRGERILSQSLLNADEEPSNQVLDMTRVTSEHGYYMSDAYSLLTVYLFDSTTDWYIVQTTQVLTFFGFLQQMIWPLILVFVSFIIMGSFSYFLYRKVSSPIFTLVEAMKALETLDFTMPILDVNRNDEIGYLNNGYLTMLNELQRLFDGLVREESAKKNAEIHALQLQMNPHFLYNTLTVVRYLIDLEQNQNAGQVLISLIKLLKINLDPKREMITVAEEAQYLQNYVLIQKHRYDNFDVDYSISPDCLSCLLPRLLIQPLVENSLFHGLKNGNTYGHIRICIDKRDSHLFVSVADTGVGFSKDFDLTTETISTERNSVSIGLKNVNERLCLRYGKDAGLRITSNGGMGAVVSFAIPV